MTSFTWKSIGVEAEEKLKDLKRCFSGLYLEAYPLTITVLAVPCSPITSTALSCLAMVSMRKVVQTLSTLGTNMEAYSGTLSGG